jgi:hypothetical protein
VDKKRASLLDDSGYITHDGIHVIYLYKIMENEISERKFNFFPLFPV